MSPAARKWLFAALRLAVCIAALGWVLYNVTYYDYVRLTDGREMRARRIDFGDDGVSVTTPQGERITVERNRIARQADGALDVRIGLGTTIRKADQRTLWLCLLIFSPVTFIQSLRFRWMLRAQGIDISYWESVKLCFAGNFLNFITALGSMGGDVFKMYYVSLHTDRKTEAVTTVVLDRFAGLYGLLLIVCALLAARTGDAKINVLAYGLGVLVAGTVVAYALLFSPRVRAVLKPASILGRLPFGSHWLRAEAATRRLAEHKGLVLGALAATVVLQLIALSSMVLAARALHMRWDTQAVGDYFTYLAGGVVVAAIPISPQGLGTMEAYYKYVFLDSHGSLAALLCLAMAVRAINLCWSLPGVIVTMTGSYRPRVSEEQMRFGDGSQSDANTASP